MICYHLSGERRRERGEIEEREERANDSRRVIFDLNAGFQYVTTGKKNASRDTYLARLILPLAPIFCNCCHGGISRPGKLRERHDSRKTNKVLICSRSFYSSPSSALPFAGAVSQFASLHILQDPLALSRSPKAERSQIAGMGMELRANCTHRVYQNLG